MEANFPTLRNAGMKSLQVPKCFSGSNIESSLKFMRSRSSMKSMSLIKSRRRVYCALANSSHKALTSPIRQKTEYKDNWIENMAINYLCHCVQEATGMSTDLDGYDGLVDVISRTSQGFSPIVQRELIVHALRQAVPDFLLSFVRQTENIDGPKQKTTVHVKKCRILESTNCVGVCTNLCKIPSQQFIGQYLGTPMTLTPNFEDMSCEVVFGKEPASIEEDPAFSQPCYKLCKLKKPHTEKCSDKKRTL